MSILFKPAIRTRCYFILYLDTKFQYLKQKEHSWRTEGIIFNCNYSILFSFSLINLPDCKVKLNEVIFKFIIGPVSNVTSYYLTSWEEVVLVYISYFIKVYICFIKLLKDLENIKMLYLWVHSISQLFCSECLLDCQRFFFYINL